MINCVKKIFLLIFCLFYSCTYTDQFIIYPSSNIEEKDYFIAANFQLFFNEEDIHNDYIEIAIIATDMYYYGNFFFDDIFMSLLEKKVYSMNGNAVIYNKNKIDYEDYNKNYLYFKVIKILEKKDEL